MSLYLINAPLNVAALNRWAARRGMIKRGVVDEGFVLHKLLSESFGKGILQPFRLFSSRSRNLGEIYAYSNAERTELQFMAAAVASPAIADVIGISDLRSKPMPGEFRQSQVLGFDIRLRPTRRSKRVLAGSNGINRRKRGDFS